MPVEAADDYLMVHQLLISGMNCMRINCAHDYPEIWSRMIETLRSAEQSTGLSCRILMDLGGPKLRLGPMETQPDRTQDPAGPDIERQTAASGANLADTAQDDVF